MKFLTVLCFSLACFAASPDVAVYVQGASTTSTGTGSGGVSTLPYPDVCGINGNPCTPGSKYACQVKAGCFLYHCSTGTWQVWYKCASGVCNGVGVGGDCGGPVINTGSSTTTTAYMIEADNLPPETLVQVKLADQVVDGHIVTGTSYEGTHELTIEDLAHGTHTFEVTFSDLAGNTFATRRFQVKL